MFRLNPASPADQDFIFNAFKASMKSYVEWAWGWDEEAQRKALLSEKNLASFQLIMLGNDRAGALLLEKHADHHYLRTIFLLPQHHRQGIGSLVMQSLQRNAQMASKPLRLRVIHTNPAQKLYARLGFTVMEQDDKTLLMQWHELASRDILSSKLHIKPEAMGFGYAKVYSVQDHDQPSTARERHAPSK